MREVLKDAAIGLGWALLIVAAMLFASFDSTFVYQAF